MTELTPTKNNDPSAIAAELLSDPDFDQKHLWHPYSSIPSSTPVYSKGANGILRICAVS